MADAWNIIILVIGGFGGLAGIAALWNARTTAKKSQIDVLRTVINTLQEENERLSAKVAAFDAVVKQLKIENARLEEINEGLRAINDELRGRIQEFKELVEFQNGELPEGE